MDELFFFAGERASNCGIFFVVGRRRVLVGVGVAGAMLLVAMKMNVRKGCQQPIQPLIGDRVGPVEIERLQPRHSLELVEPGVRERHIDQMQKPQVSDAAIFCAMPASVIRRLPRRN